MTSELQRAANRANAKRSTGPKTPLGKGRASANALRHGLATQRLYKAADRRKILLLADQIMKSACGRLSLPRAHAIATAQFELERARSAEASLLRRIAEGTLAELEPMDRKSALNGLKMVRRYSSRLRMRRDRLLREAFPANAQNEPNF
jgi:hypothetical protein